MADLQCKQFKCSYTQNSGTIKTNGTTKPNTTRTDNELNKTRGLNKQTNELNEQVQTMNNHRNR